jgi:hypothetical protein
MKTLQKWHSLGNSNIDFLTFAIEECETFKFWTCSKETEILQSSFKNTKSKTKSQQSTLQISQKASAMPLTFCEML